MIRIGQRVRVRGSKRAGIITEIRADGRVKVALGSLTILADPSDLTMAPEPPNHGVDTTPPNYELAGGPPAARTFQKPLDLHGLREADARTALERHLDGAILAGIDRFEVIHGIGNGVLMQMVESYLRQCSSVRHFKRAENNPGSTWVYL